MFNRILIANRGEIALRIIRTCREMGIESVVVYSQADKDGSWVKLADRAICIGAAASADSYLNIPRIIAAAELAEVQAIHPGYGFLAENSHFAEVCRSCGLEFIGPTVETMQAVGDKIQAKHIADKAKCPCVPGSEDAIADAVEAAKLAKSIGLPIALKAAAGGGGRGIRCVRDEDEVETAFRQAQVEAELSFGDGRLYVEKWIDSMRHIEVQVLGDMHGNLVHLWERDCTVQRRRQKLIEETPSPAISEDLRHRICESAVRLCKQAGYHGAGTVEFILAGEDFYFMEVNARIQVEHPVSEMVTGIDLIEWQIRVAAGEKLPFTQEDIPRNGCAIECRINAEDPEANFRPSPGRIEAFFPPGGYGVRLDSHIQAGYTVPPTYDSLLGKLIVHGRDRQHAIARMKRALSELDISPIKTTTGLYMKILSNPVFVSGDYDTNFLDKTELV